MVNCCLGSVFRGLGGCGRQTEEVTTRSFLLVGGDGPCAAISERGSQVRIVGLVGASDFWSGRPLAQPPVPPTVVPGGRDQMSQGSSQPCQPRCIFRERVFIMTPAMCQSHTPSECSVYTSTRPPHPVLCGNITLSSSGQGSHQGTGKWLCSK